MCRRLVSVPGVFAVLVELPCNLEPLCLDSPFCRRDNPIKENSALLVWRKLAESELAGFQPRLKVNEQRHAIK